MRIIIYRNQVIAVHYLSLEHCEIVWPLSTMSVKS
jgi:hypothetical protein